MLRKHIISQWSQAIIKIGQCHSAKKNIVSTKFRLRLHLAGWWFYRFPFGEQIIQEIQNKTLYVEITHNHLYPTYSSVPSFLLYLPLLLHGTGMQTTLTITSYVHLLTFVESWVASTLCAWSLFRCSRGMMVLCYVKLAPYHKPAFFLDPARP